MNRDLIATLSKCMFDIATTFVIKRNLMLHMNSLWHFVIVYLAHTRKMDPSCSWAASFNRLDVIIHEYKYGGLKLRPILMSRAAEAANFNILNWLIDHKCEWDNFVCPFAAKKGHLHVLKFLREKGCPWDKKTIYFAAGGGHIHILKWLREQGCPWDKEAYLYAAEGKHLHVLEWLVDNGCPIEKYLLNFAGYNDLHIVYWAFNHDCYIPDDKISFRRRQLIYAKKLLQMSNYAIFKQFASDINKWIATAEIVCDEICYDDLSNLIKQFI